MVDLLAGLGLLMVVGGTALAVCWAFLIIIVEV